MDRDNDTNLDANQQQVAGSLIGTTDDGAIYKRVNNEGEELPILVVCSEHLEQGLDEFVDEYEQPPDLYRLKDVHFSNWQPPETCVFCKNKPMFLVL